MAPSVRTSKLREMVTGGGGGGVYTRPSNTQESWTEPECYVLCLVRYVTNGLVEEDLHGRNHRPSTDRQDFTCPYVGSSS
jgi:hypothetical protein